MAKITYDKDGNILNIKISSSKIVDTHVHGSCILDYDKRGNVANVEILDIDLASILRAIGHLA